MAEQGKERTAVITPADVTYRPDYAIPPGETLRETLESSGMTQADLARRTSLSAKHINQIVQGVAPISPDTSFALERVLGVPARFWLALEANYQSRQTRLRERTVSDEDVAWLKSPAFKELVKRGIIEATSDLAELRDRVLSFFGVVSREAWRAVWDSPGASFRRSAAFQADPVATAAWLRLGELQASGMETPPFDKDRFQAALPAIRSIMVQDPEHFEPEMRRLCSESGVVLAIVDEVKGCRAHGAARWLPGGRALIQLSLRGRWEDQFWFSFFHEAGHLLLHSRREAYVDDPESNGPEEDEADKFAASVLIPPDTENALLRIRTLDETRALALKLGIPPGIVVGRLQRERIFDYTVGNKLRRRFSLVP
jgi:HTH-type transcriptional regulator/antitoxin HigA